MMLSTNYIRTPTEIVAKSIAEASTIIDRRSNAFTTIKAKKRRINEVYESNNTWIEEDEYGGRKARHLCRVHMFPNLKSLMGEGQKSLTAKLEKRGGNILEYGQCHYKAALLQNKGYACHLMKMIDITEDNTKIEDGAMWWKTYAHSVNDKIRKIRGKTIGSIKICVTHGVCTLCLYD